MDLVADDARMTKVTAAIIAELARQNVAVSLAHSGFDPAELAKVAIRAADGDMIQFPPPLVPGSD